MKSITWNITNTYTQVCIIIESYYADIRTEQTSRYFRVGTFSNRLRYIFKRHYGSQCNFFFSQSDQISTVWTTESSPFSNSATHWSCWWHLSGLDEVIIVSPAMDIHWLTGMRPDRPYLCTSFKHTWYLKRASWTDVIVCIGV